MTKYNTEPFAIEYHNARLSGFKTEKGAKNRIVFAGCSMIEFGQWQDLLNNSTMVNRGILGDNSFGLLNRIDDIINLQPKILLIMIGINDIAGNIPVNVTCKNICTFVKKLNNVSPSTKVFVHSILPTNPVYSEHKTEFINHYKKNKQVEQLNNSLKEESSSYNFSYIDLHSSFKDKNGNLNAEFSDTDGIHLNAKGYKLWTDLLRRKYSLNF
jgi:lysophospholipase L1-like esterase